MRDREKEEDKEDKERKRDKEKGGKKDSSSSSDEGVDDFPLKKSKKPPPPPRPAPSDSDSPAPSEVGDRPVSMKHWPHDLYSGSHVLSASVSKCADSFSLSESFVTHTVHLYQQCNLPSNQYSCNCWVLQKYRTGCHMIMISYDNDVVPPNDTTKG